MDTVYRKAASLASQGQSCALVVVTKAAGHTPQHVGARMLVHPDGTIEGTVGGGRFEHEVILLAQDVALQTTSVLKDLQLGAELGMCCGGRMEVLISPISSQDTWLSEVSEQQRSGREIWLSTCLDASSLGVRTVSRDPSPLDGERRYATAGVVTGDQGDRRLVERLVTTPRMVLFGAGHVAQPTARLGSMLGYRVVVVDDRPDWNSETRFPTADERVLATYEDFLFDFQSNPDDALLIITRGHDFDQMILEAVVGHQVAYLGMIGSRTKTTKALKKLRARGIDEALIGRIHAPIGLAIGALTPEEIGVAIAAQLVKVQRNGRGER